MSKRTKESRPKFLNRFNLTTRQDVQERINTLPQELRGGLQGLGRILAIETFPTGEHNNKTVAKVEYTRGIIRRRIIAKHTDEADVLRGETLGLRWANHIPGIRRRTIAVLSQSDQYIFYRYFPNDGMLRDLVIERRIPIRIARKIKHKYTKWNMRAWESSGSDSDNARQGLKERGDFSMQHSEMNEVLASKSAMLSRLGGLLGISPEAVNDANLVFETAGDREEALSINNLFGRIESAPRMENSRFLRWGNLDLASKNILVKYRKILSIIPHWKWRIIDWEMTGRVNIGEALAVDTKALVFSKRNVPKDIRWSYDGQKGSILVQADKDAWIPNEVRKLEHDTLRQAARYARRTRNKQLLSEIAFCLGWNYLHAAAFSDDPSIAVFNLREASRWMKDHDRLVKENGNVSLKARRSGTLVA